MKKKFKAEVLAGHKEDAVEVPFDPAVEWGLPPQPLYKGRRGHKVSGTVNGFALTEGLVVPRQKKFYLLLDQELELVATINVGDRVQIVIEPLPSH